MDFFTFLLDFQIEMNSKKSEIFFSSTLWFFLSLLVVISTTGCGSSSIPPAPAPVPQAAPETNNTKPVTQTPATSPEKLPAGVRRDEEGKKWLGDVPYDIWFEKPLEIVSQDQLLTGRNQGTPSVSQDSGKNATSTADLAKNPPSTTNQTETNSSSSNLSGELLADEVKRIQNQLQQLTRNVGTYNRSLKAVGAASVSLILMGNLAAEHPDRIPWKEQSAAVLECGRQILAASETSGRESLKTAKEALETLVVILNGESVAAPANAGSELTLGEEAPLDKLMNRVDESEKWLSAEISSEKEMKRNLNSVQREAALLETLAQTMGLNSYELSEESLYQEEADNLKNASRNLFKSATEQNWTNYQSALDQVKKSCNDCHTEYR